MGWGRYRRQGVREGPATGIIFVMATEFLNACLIFFAPAIVVACIIDHEEAGALIILAAVVVVARVIVWVRDKFRITGGRQ